MSCRRTIKDLSEPCLKRQAGMIPIAIGSNYGNDEV
jgi:hypothetical protein